LNCAFAVIATSNRPIKITLGMSIDFGVTSYFKIADCLCTSDERSFCQMNS
jgi:hypothetical protein